MRNKQSPNALSRSYSRVSRSRHRVYVGLNTHYGYGRAIFEGVIAYAQKVGTWRFQYQFDPDHVDDLTAEVTADGVIVEGQQPRFREQLHQLALPTVLVAVGTGWGFPKVVPDNWKVGRMAVDYFKALGFGQVAWTAAGRWLGHPAHQVFERVAHEQGLPCHNLPDAGAGDLTQWLRDLPRPIAVFMHAHELGVQVIEACNEAGIHVPEEVAVLSVGCDDLLCNLSRPALSSFDHGLFNVGYQAAALLDAQMNGRPFERQVVVEPVGIFERQSTDTLAIGDAQIAQAVRFVRERAFDAIRVPDILRVVPISRRALEMGFRRWLGRSVHEEITRVRVERAKNLLIRTDMAMPDIAAHCGFGSASQLSVTFRRELDITPGDFRNRHRMR
jgi:LacI family transcriptional regulator